MGIFVLCGTAEYAIHRLIIYPSFLALERDEAQKDLERSVQALKREIHHLDSLAHDWSTWNDTYRFVRAPFEDYVRSRPILSALLKDRDSKTKPFKRECKPENQWGKDIYG